MQDTIILGNGTSKQIKTASLPDSYAEFKAMAENGNLFADIKLNADGCEVVGTPLNKQNLLTDETAGKIGNPENIDKAIKNLVEAINSKPVTITRTVIFEGNAYELSNLSNPLSDFDFIEIAYKMRYGGMQVVSITSVESMLSEINGEKGYYLAPFLLSNNEMYFGDAYATKFTNNTLIYTSKSNTIRVVGIKLSI